MDRNRKLLKAMAHAKRWLAEHELEELDRAGIAKLTPAYKNELVRLAATYMALHDKICGVCNCFVRPELVTLYKPDKIPKDWLDRLKMPEDIPSKLAGTHLSFYFLLFVLSYMAA